MASKKKVNKNTLICPFCGCTHLETSNTKVKRFPKTHLFKFSCGYGFLYNKKTNTVFHDIDWMCGSVSLNEAGTVMKVMENSEKREASSAKKYLSKKKG